MAQLRVDTQLVTHSSRPHRPRGSRGGTGVLLCTAWGAAARRPGPSLPPPVPAAGEASPSRALPAWPRPRGLPARPGDHGIPERRLPRPRGLCAPALDPDPGRAPSPHGGPGPGGSPPALPPAAPAQRFPARKSRRRASSSASGAGLSCAGPALALALAAAQRLGASGPRGLPRPGPPCCRPFRLVSSQTSSPPRPGRSLFKPQVDLVAAQGALRVPRLVKPYAEKPIKTTWTADLHNCEMISVGLLDYMVTTFTCGRVSRECQDLPPGDLLSHQELLWKLCQTDPKVRYIIEKVCWEATKDYFDMKNYEKLKVLWLSYVKFWKSVTTGGEQNKSIQLLQRGDTSRQEKGIQTPGLVQFAFYPSPSQRRLPSSGLGRKAVLL
ncbi:nascent polypeptide-associated complex subunit alpha, muscle-specific form-like isoform X1 [Canis lupus familiaris]|uniref:nascent polypeptide-associated complex subunit alpha, muscle-specific form-like isoform X1 n=1 Tax=Canis lupus familiaris TaxID=9615 RepID=UPI000BAA2E63|nr:nascent polypeptide-associated complex subunit alpha, muscle-specific form-like isoform X1 [Canis lupus familiaris]|eukprot:XP_022268222.1 nascent polypeptide-associated complex subunit alpha, muscle-specific form-like [Canis lupus familiaris]